MSMRFLVLLVINLHVVLVCSRRDGSRSKRVVGGHVPIVNKERTFEYEVIRYFVWIGVASSCTSPKTVPVDVPKWWLVSSRPCFPDIDDQRCGGSLIHPRIVQTAGHCVGSEVHYVKNPKNPWAPGQVWSVWENMMQVFVGYTDIEDFQDPAYSRVLLLHPRYARLRTKQYNWVSHDYGWIILNSEPTKLGHWPKLVAPTLTARALAVHSAELLRNQEVCLFAGFGAWQYSGDRILNTTSSRYLRYGWQLTAGYNQCWRYLYILTGVHRARNWRYSKRATWFCHIPFGEHVSDHPGVGDSGGPVLCNGRMLALVSGGKWLRTSSTRAELTHITRTMGLAYSAFENAADYRKYFVLTLKYYAKVRLIAHSVAIFKNPNRREVDPHSTLLEYSMKSKAVLRTVGDSRALSAIPVILTFFNSSVRWAIYLFMKNVFSKQ